MDAHVVTVLLDRVQTHPEKPAFEYLRSNGESAGILSYGELLIQATAIAAYLQQVFSLRERLVLLFPPGLDFITCFFGCLLGGMVPVPLAPPSRHGALGLELVVTNAAAGGILGVGPQLERWHLAVKCNPRMAEVPWIRVDQVDSQLAASWHQPAIHASDLALLQYTSGSTRTPRGVALSHRNILANSELIRRKFGTDRHTIGVSWLPHHHDMGLIGNIIQPIYAGGMGILMAPTTFLHRPLNWLGTISSRRATVSGGPCFAYEHCLSRMTEADRAGLDLSTWELAYCGAEPIKASVLKGFVDRFQSVGFREQAFLPCYGLAEGTLMVCSAPKDEAPRIFGFDSLALSRGVAKLSMPGNRSCDLVACGRYDSGQRVIIVDAAQWRRLDPGHLGEIWVQGEGIADGYYRHPEENTRFHTTLAGEQGDWLRTGDLGFVFEGQIFVVGRSHDRLVIHGRNLFAHDIEWGLIDLDPDLGRCVAFAGESTDQLVVIQELAARHSPNDHLRLILNVRRRIFTQMGIEPDAVVLVPHGTIPFTTSGKPRRVRCRELFLRGELVCLMQWRPGDSMASAAELSSKRSTDEIRSWLIDKLANRLQVACDEVNPSIPLFESGLTSLDAVELCLELEHWLERPLSPTIIFNYPTINSLSDHLGMDTVMMSPKDAVSSCLSPVNQDPASMPHEALEKWIDLLYEDNKRNL